MKIGITMEERAESEKNALLICIKIYIAMDVLHDNTLCILQPHKLIFLLSHNISNNLSKINFYLSTSSSFKPCLVKLILCYISKT